MNLAAVLWDMDGTLVDTEPYWIEEEFRLVAERGTKEWSEENTLLLVGNDLLTSAEIIRERGGVDMPAEDIINRLLDAVIAKVKEKVPFRPGARELLLSLGAAGVPCALVTMSYRNLAQTVLDSLPAGTFAALIPGDEVSHGKPHPEPYLKAAAVLGVRPEDCVAIEDSIPGLASAEAAGTTAIGVAHMIPLPELPGRILLDTLDGVSLATLEELHAARRAAIV